MDLYSLLFVLTFVYPQSLCFVRGATLPVKILKNDADNSTTLGLSGYAGLEGGASTKDVNSLRPTLINCVAGMMNRSAQLFGIYANISVWGHEHIKPDAYSATIMQVSNDQGGEYNAIRAGLHTLPSLYNDTKLHFFAQWTTDRDWRTGCYNMDCPGFVPFRNTHADMPIPGTAVDAVSSYGGADSSMALQIVKDGRPGAGGNGDWWLYRVSGPLRFPLGHWPAALFTSLSRHATVAAWYGAVGFPPRARDEPLPPMGSGHGPAEGYARAAYFADFRLMDGMANPVDASLAGVMPLANAEGCYKLAMDTSGGGDANSPPYTFFYGGPVSHAC